MRIFIANLKITCLAISCLLVFTADVRAEKSKVFWGGLGFSTFGDSSQTPSAEALRNCAAEDSLDRCGGHDIFEMSRDIFVSSQFDHLEVEARMLPFDQQIGNILSPTISSEFVIKGKVDGKFFYTFLVTGSLMIYEVEANKTNLILPCHLVSRLMNTFPNHYLNKKNSITLKIGTYPKIQKSISLY